MGQNFSWPKQVGHELEQQRAGNLRNEVRRICVKNWMQVTFQPHQRPKQLPAHPQELHFVGKELGLMLNQENIRSPIIHCRRNWSIFFVMEAYLKTMMERLKRKSSESFLALSSLVWRSGRAAGQEEDKRKYFSIVLIQEQFYTSELFKVVQDAIPLILLYRTNNVIIPDGFFKYIYHVGCAINLHSIINSGLTPEGQNTSNR